MFNKLRRIFGTRFDRNKLRADRRARCALSAAKIEQTKGTFYFS